MSWEEDYSRRRENGRPVSPNWDNLLAKHTTCVTSLFHFINSYLANSLLLHVRYLHPKFLTTCVLIESQLVEWAAVWPDNNFSQMHMRSTSGRSRTRPLNWNIHIDAQSNLIFIGTSKLATQPLSTPSNSSDLTRSCKRHHSFTFVGRLKNLYWYMIFHIKI